jgi:Superfamily II DNA helicase
MLSESEIRDLARSRLGFERLRPGQLRAVAAATSGRDVLAVLSTGGGKSAIYELAGLMGDAPTVVVSPLLALQDDQLAHLRAAGLRAVVLNSQQSAVARTDALLATCDSNTFVFVSPEQLTNAETRDALRRARPGLFVVDEAHLISQWGHDFRPDYMLLGAHADALDVRVRIALTATAALPVREEICRRLRLRDPEVVVGDFDRPHIELSARRTSSVAEKHRELERAADEFAGAGIVYAATHANAQRRMTCSPRRRERDPLPRRALGAGTARGDGRVSRRLARIVAATVAFGMGIDKPDVRWVCTSIRPHRSTRTTRSSAAPAGTSRTHMRVCSFARRLRQGKASDGAKRRCKRRGHVAERLSAGQELGGLAQRQQTAAIARLVDLGAAVWEADGEVRWTDALSVAQALRASSAETVREHELERSRLEMMRRYAEHQHCRRSFLLTYFGQNYRGPCGHCDNDDPARPAQPPPPSHSRSARAF